MVLSSPENASVAMNSQQEVSKHLRLIALIHVLETELQSVAGLQVSFIHYTFCVGRRLRGSWYASSPASGIAAVIVEDILL